jgi:hypothetical protein
MAARTRRALRAATGLWCQAGGFEAKSGQQPVEQGRDAGQGAAVVEQAGNGAQQVAEQVSGPGYGGDVQVHRSQVDDQAQQVEVNRPKVQVKDRAARHCQVLDWRRECGAASGQPGSGDGSRKLQDTVHHGCGQVAELSGEGGAVQ